MTATRAQTDTLEHLDFPDPCTAVESCDRPADFSGHCRTCDAVELICARCFNAFLDYHGDGNPFHCEKCDRRERHFLSLVTIRPLLRRAIA